MKYPFTISFVHLLAVIFLPNLKTQLIKKKKDTIWLQQKGGTDKTIRTSELQVSTGTPIRNYKETMKGWLTEQNKTTLEKN